MINFCVLCNKNKYIRAKGMCNSCYEKNRPHNICIICKNNKGNTNRSICDICNKKNIINWKCSKCGTNLKKHGSFCRRCYENNRSKIECKKCNKKRVLNGNGLCKNCYIRPIKQCNKCYNITKIYAYDMCYNCFIKTDLHKYKQKISRIRRRSDIYKKIAMDRSKYISSVGMICKKCGSTKNIHKHHPDYRRPKYIVPLCVKCHMKLHANRRKKTNKLNL